MDKREALQVLNEILKTCIEELGVLSLSLEQPIGSGNYVIRMEASLDDNSRKELNSILDKHNLTLEETKNFVIVHSPNMPSEERNSILEE